MATRSKWSAPKTWGVVFDICILEMEMEWVLEQVCSARRWLWKFVRMAKMYDIGIGEKSSFLYLEFWAGGFAETFEWYISEKVAHTKTKQKKLPGIDNQGSRCLV